MLSCFKMDLTSSTLFIIKDKYSKVERSWLDCSCCLTVRDSYFSVLIVLLRADLFVLPSVGRCCSSVRRWFLVLLRWSVLRSSSKCCWAKTKRSSYSEKETFSIASPAVEGLEDNISSRRRILGFELILLTLSETLGSLLERPLVIDWAVRADRGRCSEVGGMLAVGQTMKQGTFMRFSILSYRHPKIIYWQREQFQHSMHSLFLQYH